MAIVNVVADNDKSAAPSPNPGMPLILLLTGGVAVIMMFQ
jgi:hypothetical protein